MTTRRGFLVGCSAAIAQLASARFTSLVFASGGGCDGLNLVLPTSGADRGIYGSWLGLENGALFDGADLPVTTDYRRVLSEIAVRRFGNPNWDQVFPGYAGYSPIGLFDDPLFCDGFETGGLGGWSVPG